MGLPCLNFGFCCIRGRVMQKAGEQIIDRAA
jgi:hypothetical protein